MPASPRDPTLVARLKDALIEAGVAADPLRRARPGADLFHEGLLDSIVLPAIVRALEKTFGVKIPLADFERWNFASLDAMAALVERRKARGGS